MGFNQFAIYLNSNALLNKDTFPKDVFTNFNGSISVSEPIENWICLLSSNIFMEDHTSKISHLYSCDAFLLCASDATGSWGYYQYKNGELKDKLEDCEVDEPIFEVNNYLKFKNIPWSIIHFRDTIKDMNKWQIINIKSQC